jgi:hypothetical protein
MPCLNGEGYTEGETKRAAAQKEASAIKAGKAGIIAADNAYQMYDNYKAQRSIAKRANDIRRLYQDFLLTEFWPKEESYLNEFANPNTHGEKPEDVEVVGSRYAGRLVPTIAKKFAEELLMTKCNSSRYCTSANKKSLQDLYLARSNALATARVAGRQQAYKEWRAHIDKNYKRRFDAVAVGDGMIAEASALLGQALTAYRTAGEVFTQQFNSAIGTLGNALGTRSSAQTRMNMVDAMNLDENDIMFAGRTPFQQGFGNTYWQMNGAGSSNMFGEYNIGLNAGYSYSANSGLSTIYSSNGESALNGSQLINQLDLARSGSHTYEVVSIIPGTVTVNMNDFPLQDYAEKDSGDRTV